MHCKRKSMIYMNPVSDDAVHCPSNPRKAFTQALLNSYFCVHRIIYTI
jgi:hypothetical protein